MLRPQQKLIITTFEIKYGTGFSQKTCDNNLEKVCFDIQKALPVSQLKFSPQKNKIKYERSKFRIQKRDLRICYYSRGKDEILYTYRLSPFLFYG